jgi:hypothetical protein
LLLEAKRSKPPFFGSFFCQPGEGSGNLSRAGIELAWLHKQIIIGQQRDQHFKLTEELAEKNTLTCVEEL